MDAGDVGIILAIVGIGLTIICMLGSRFNNLARQIEGVESRLRRELSRINSEIGGVETGLRGECLRVSHQIDGLETKFRIELSRIDSQIDSVETRLREELVQIRSEMSLLRELNANNANDISRDNANRIERLEERISSIMGSSTQKKGWKS